jgi:pSer/pThr/pTyr-binding forkhead associated (FHA) protein
MKLKTSSTNSHHSEMEESAPLVPHPAVASPHSPDCPLVEPAIEIEENGLSKAATLLIGTADPEAEPSETACQHPASTRLQYIQGIVQAQRAWIITNLLDGQSQTIFQPQMVWTVGRNREAALPLQDRAMSRRHAVILYVQNSGFQLIDLNSMNGSFVNGTRIQHRTWLKDGDRLRLGNTDFTFFFSSGRVRSAEVIHPEVLTRLNAPKLISSEFIDFSALEEPEIFFNTARLGIQ